MTQAPQPETWDLWRDHAHSPWENMALDEALLETAPRRGKMLLRLYAWDRPAVSIGFMQRWKAAPQGYHLVRRPTGGGIVYHDHDFTYSVIIPQGHRLAELDRTASYAWINSSIKEGLAPLNMSASLARQDIPHTVDRATMVCFQNPTRYDIMMADRKVAGSAQRHTQDGILHQGSLHFGGPLPIPREELTTLLLLGFQENMSVIFRPFTPPPEVLSKAAQLVSQKYGHDAWNQRR